MVKNTKTTTTTSASSHKVRTFFASIAGIIAVYLILASITVVWLNRTLTNTGTYVSTVSPLVTKPPIQNFVAAKVADQILDNAPTQDLATTLLPANELNGTQTPEQLKALLGPVIKSNVLQIVRSANFASLWKQTNQTAHTDLVAQLNSDTTDRLTLDLSPAINGVIAQLKTTELSPIADKITIKPDTGKLDIKSSGISRAHTYYKWFKEGTVAIVIVAILAIVLSVWLSVHHAKTARRILLGTGILALLQAIVLEAPRVVKLSGNDQVTQAATKAVIQALVHNLQLTSLIIGVICIAAAIGSKLYTKHHTSV